MVIRRLRLLVFLGALLALVVVSWSIRNNRWVDGGNRAYLFDDIFCIMDIREAEPGFLWLSDEMSDVSGYPTASNGHDLVSAKFAVGGPFWAHPEIYGLRSLPKPLLQESFATYIHNTYGMDFFHYTVYYEQREKFNLAGLMHVAQGSVSSYMSVRRFQPYRWGKLELEPTVCHLKLESCKVAVRGWPDKPWFKDYLRNGYTAGIKVRADFPYFLFTDDYSRGNASCLNGFEQGTSLPDGYECWYIVKNTYYKGSVPPKST